MNELGNQSVIIWPGDSDGDEDDDTANWRSWEDEVDDSWDNRLRCAAVPAVDYRQRSARRQRVPAECQLENDVPTHTWQSCQYSPSPPYSHCVYIKPQVHTLRQPTLESLRTDVQKNSTKHTKTQQAKTFRQWYWNYAAGQMLDTRRAEADKILYSRVLNAIAYIDSISGFKTVSG